MHAHKAPDGQLFFHRLEAHEGKQGAGCTFEVHFHVILQAFDVEDIAEGHAYQLIFGLKKEVFFLLRTIRTGSAGGRGRELGVGAGFAGGPQKLLVVEGLDEIVEGIDAVALQGVLAEGGSKNNARATRPQHPRQFQAVEFLHLNIKEG